MMKIRDFKCNSCRTVTEVFLTDDIKHLDCPCGGIKRRVISSPMFVLEGASGDFPGRHMKWVKEHEQAAKKNRDAEG